MFSWCSDFFFLHWAFKGNVCKVKARLRPLSPKSSVSIFRCGGPWLQGCMPWSPLSWKDALGTRCVVVWVPQSLHSTSVCYLCGALQGLKRLSWKWVQFWCLEKLENTCISQNPIILIILIVVRSVGRVLKGNAREPSVWGLLAGMQANWERQFGFGFFKVYIQNR